MAQQGSDYFYRNDFAEAVAQWMSNNGGIVTAKDFENYQLRIRQPVKSDYKAMRFMASSPPSSGGVHVAEILNILQQFEWASRPQLVRDHLMVEAMKLAFADRAHWLGDPDFVDVPKGLISPQYAKALAKKINRKRRVSCLLITSHAC